MGSLSPLCVQNAQDALTISISLAHISALANSAAASCREFESTALPYGVVVHSW